MDRLAEEKVFRSELPRELEHEVFVPLDIRHGETVRQIAAASFPAVWSEKEFAYFLCHENRLCLGLFSQVGREQRLRSYFLGMLVQGDLDIISVATQPQDRRLGLAHRLLERVCDNPEVKRAFLEVEVDNTAAFGMYEKLGFQLLGRRHSYYGPNRDAFLMRWLRPAFESTNES